MHSSDTSVASDNEGKNHDAAGDASNGSKDETNDLLDALDKSGDWMDELDDELREDVDFNTDAPWPANKKPKLYS